MVNKVILIGNLTADPERRTTPQGNVVVNIRFATNEKYKDREGTLQERTEFHRVVFWGKQAETIDRFARKGKALFIEGRIQTREYQDRDGNRRWATDIVARDFKFLGSRRDGEGGDWQRDRAETSQANRPENDRGSSGGGDARPSAPPNNRDQAPGGSSGSDWGQRSNPGSGESTKEPFNDADPWGGPGSDEDLPF